jgi:hypothetical protein
MIEGGPVTHPGVSGRKGPFERDIGCAIGRAGATADGLAARKKH